MARKRSVSTDRRPLSSRRSRGLNPSYPGDNVGDLMSLRRGVFHRVRFSNDSARLHPIHMHGMFFRVLARNGRPVDEPFFRDTVLVHGRETVDLGVVPTDTGQWMVHCHILEHAEAGMMTLVEVHDDLA